MININSESKTFNPEIEPYLWIQTLYHRLVKLKTVRKLDVIKQKFCLYHCDKKNMNKVENMHTVIIRFPQGLRQSAREKVLTQGLIFSKIILFCVAYAAF